MPSDGEILAKMKELESRFGYTFRDIGNLAKAMEVTSHENRYNEGNYRNSALAELGDSVLKAALSYGLYGMGYDRHQITSVKQTLESNRNLFRMDDALGYYRYAYNSDRFYDEGLPDHFLRDGVSDFDFEYYLFDGTFL